MSSQLFYKIFLKFPFYQILFLNVKTKWKKKENKFELLTELDKATESGTKKVTENMSA